MVVTIVHLPQVWAEARLSVLASEEVPLVQVVSETAAQDMGAEVAEPMGHQMLAVLELKVRF